MNKRDLKADLEFCDRATQGPWKHEWNPDYSEVYAPGFNNPIILVRHDPYDADFIVQAREGWPHAIERALKAESLVRELAEILNGIQGVTIVASLAADSEDGTELLVKQVSRARPALAKVREVLGDE